MNDILWFEDRRYSKITERHPNRIIYPDFYKARRMEYVLRPGEMIFIPHGWFHFVFSEDPDPDSGLCAAINFWYVYNESEIEKTIDKPRFGWHNISFDEVLESISSEKLIVYLSSNKIFPPLQFKNRFPICYNYMTFDEFYEARNNNHYIAQNEIKNLEKFNISPDKSIYKSSIWINWGNCNTIPHYDGHDNWLCQLKGTRRVILTPPEDRDFMYLFNSYPLDLLYKINQKLSYDENLIHLEYNSINQDVIQEILKSLGKQEEAFIECTELSMSFEKELDIHNFLLVQNGSMEIPSTLKCTTFQIKKYSREDCVESNSCMGVLWFLTNGKVKIRKNTLDVEQGSVISFPGNWLYPVKVESDCILIKPYGGFSNGT